MKLGCQKKLAYALIAAAVVACSAVAVLGRRALEERWLISRLGSANFFHRRDAARRLGEMQAAGAVPALLARLVAEASTEPPKPGRCSRDVSPLFATAAVPYWYAIQAVGKEAIPELTARLTAGDVRTRTWAADLLGNILRDLCPDGGEREPGEAPASAIQALVAHLDDPDEEVRREAAWALWRADEAAGPALLSVLEGGSATARAGAAWALRGGYWFEARVVPALLKAARDPARKVRFEAASALLVALRDVLGDADRAAIEAARGSLQRTLLEAAAPEDLYSVLEQVSAWSEWPDSLPDFLRRHLADPDPDVREAARQVFFAFELPDAAFPILAESLAHPDVSTRVAAVHGLAASDGRRPEVLGALIRGLADSADEVHREAVSVLSGAGARAVPRLLAALEHEDPRLRSGAAAALGDLSLTAETNTVATATLAEGAFARLKGLLRDPSPEVRRAAAEALGYVAGWTFQGSARLLPLLDDGDARVRAGAAVAIGASGESPDGFGARLVTVLEDLSGEDRVLGLEALLFIAEGEVEVVSPVIVRMLESEDDRTRRAAIRAAARLGGAASDASLRLRKLFREDPRVREDVLRALIELHGGASGLEPEIESALRSREAGLRSIAIEAIQGAQVPSLVPDLIEALSRLEVGEAREAIEAVARISGLRTEGLIDRFAETLGTIAGKNPAVLLGLKNLLSDRDLRLGAIKALAHAGKAGRAAIPDLKRIAWERAPEIQDAIAGTVLALEGAPEG